MQHKGTVSLESERLVLRRFTMDDAEELGTVWIGEYPLKNRVDLFRRIFHIPEHVIPMCMIYVGYPAEQREARHRLNEKRVYHQEYDPNRKHRSKDKPVIGHY